MIKARTTLLLLLVIAVTAGIPMFTKAFQRFGHAPTAEEKQSFYSSENFDTKRNSFINANQEFVDDMRRQMASVSNIIKQLMEFSRAKDLAPSTKMPEQAPDFASFAQSQQGLQVIWFGHSSFLLNMDGTIILVDPVFGNASPVPKTGKRFQQSIVRPEQLPKIDVIVISHDHYDHLEMETMQYFANTDAHSQPHFMVPLGVGAHLRHWGVKPQDITERDWWQSKTVKGVEFTATPAQHFSGRTGLHGNDTLWASWVIQSPSNKIYFSGDTGYSEHFKTIGERLGPFDLAFIENGQYNPQWRSIHMLPEDGVQAFKDLNAKKYFPIHWGMFTLSLHTWDDPIKQISQLAQQHNIELVTPRIGETVDLRNYHPSAPWWQAQDSETLLAYNDAISSGDAPEAAQ